MSKFDQIINKFKPILKEAGAPVSTVNSNFLKSNLTGQQLMDYLSTVATPEQIAQFNQLMQGYGVEPQQQAGGQTQQSGTQQQAGIQQTGTQYPPQQSTQQSGSVKPRINTRTRPRI